MDDRSYYRALPDSALIEKARESRNELAFTLAERLQDVLDEFYAYRASSDR